MPSDRLFQVLLAFQLEPPELPAGPGLTVRARQRGTGTAKVDLLLTPTERTDPLTGHPAGITEELEYASGLFGRPSPADWRTACSRCCAYLKRLRGSVHVKEQRLISSLGSSWRS